MPGVLSSKYPIPGLAGCSYGNVVFNATCRTKLSVTPKYDDADRIVVGLGCRLSVTGFISPGDFFLGAGDVNLDAGYMTMALNQDGQRLIYYGLGAGNVDVGPGSAPGLNFLGWKELNWGPKPRLLALQSLGGGLAARFTWEVEWEMAKCQLPNGGIYSWSHEVDYSITQGMTTRTIHGQVMIAQQRIGPGVRDVIDNVDKLLELVEPPHLVGYERTVSRHLGKDRRTLNYTFTDKQKEGTNAYPPGVRNIDVKHSISSVGGTPGALVQWIWRIGGTVTMHQDQNTSQGIIIGLQILKQRVMYMARQYGVSGGLFSMGTNKAGRILALPIRMSVTESLYNAKTTDFEFALMVVVNDINLRQNLVPLSFISRSGLYLSTGDNWEDWSISTFDIFSPRGLAQRGYTSESDRLVDVCDPLFSNVGNSGGGSGGGGGTAGGGGGGGGTQPVDGGKPTVAQAAPPIPPDDIITSGDPPVDDTVFEIVTSPEQNAVIFFKDDVKVYTENGTAFQYHSIPIGTASTSPLVKQLIHSPTVRVVQSGSKIQFGRIVEAPPLLGSITFKDYVAIDPVLVGGDVVHCEEYGNLLGIPLYRVTWERVYRIETTDPVKHPGPVAPTESNFRLPPGIPE